jgi:hypothetical protein
MRSAKSLRFISPGDRIDVRLLAHLLGEVGLLGQHALDRDDHRVHRVRDAMQLARPRQLRQQRELALRDVDRLLLHIVERPERKPQYDEHRDEGQDRDHEQHPRRAHGNPVQLGIRMAGMAHDFDLRGLDPAVHHDRAHARRNEREGVDEPLRHALDRLLDLLGHERRALHALTRISV